MDFRRLQVGQFLEGAQDFVAQHFHLPSRAETGVDRDAGRFFFLLRLLWRREVADAALHLVQ